MRDFWRLLLLAAALTVTVAAGQATAQTVVVTKAPPGAAVELGLNAATLGTATADQAGIATLKADLESRGRKKPDADVRIYVDVCEKARRVTLLETGWEAPPPGVGCTRHEIFGVFYLQKITTIVVSAAEEAQAVWIKQGPAPDTWLHDVPIETDKKTGSDMLIPKGMVLSAGGGVSRYSNASTVSCGTLTSCASSDLKVAVRIGGDFWIKPYLAVSGSYLKPWGASATGSDTGYRFDTSLKPNVVTMTGKVAAPVGRIRLYAEAGAAYNWTTRTTSQTMDDKTITVDGLPIVVAGGTQVFELTTEGWSWTYGGGAEFWLTPMVAIWGEYSWVKLTGKATGGGEGSLNDSLTSVIAGMRVRLGKN
jgi:opacity protein-like surface antigen